MGSSYTQLLNNYCSIIAAESSEQARESNQFLQLWGLELPGIEAGWQDLQNLHKFPHGIRELEPDSGGE